MIDKSVLDSIARVRMKIDSYALGAMTQIIDKSEDLRYLGKDFTFSRKKSLERKINSILADTTDMIVDRINTSCEESVSEDLSDEQKLAAVTFGMSNKIDSTATEKVDLQMTHLKRIMEGWLAIGFANSLSAGEIMAKARTYSKNPYISPEWRKARKEGGYKSDMVRNGGHHYGSGNFISPVDGTIALASFAILSAYQYGEVESLRKTGAVGYEVNRGSTYDCSVCDSLCGYTHPLTEIVLPAHPHCMCYITPVFE